MFTQLIRFEAYYQLKQRALPIFATIFFLLGFLASSQGNAPANVNFNSGYQINFFTGLFSLGIAFVVIFFSVSGILRDSQFRMDSLIFSTAISKNQFFWSRFLGVFLFSLLAFTPLILGLLTGFSLSNLDPERFSDSSILHFLRSWLFIIVPNVFFCSSIIFTVSALSKSNLATYLSAIFIYMLYMISGIYLNSPLMAQSVPASPEAMAIAALADPFGISAFYEQTQFWTPFQKNTLDLSFSGLFLWNRVLWLGISFGVLLITYRLFSFRKVNQKIKNLDDENITSSAFSRLGFGNKFVSQLLNSRKINAYSTDTLKVLQNEKGKFEKWSIAGKAHSTVSFEEQLSDKLNREKSSIVRIAHSPDFFKEQLRDNSDLENNSNLGGNSAFQRNDDSFFDFLKPNFDSKLYQNISALYSLVKIELSGVLKSLPFLGILLIWVIIVFVEINSRVNGGGAYGDSWYPFTNLLIELFVEPMTFFTIIPIMFYSGEIVWRERSLNFNGIVDATPVVNWVFFLSKLIALLVLPTLFIASGIILSMSFQAASSYFDFELNQYLNLFYHNGLPLFVYCFLALFVQSLVRNKYLGMGITGLIILGSLLSPIIGIEHPMLRFAYFPRLTYSNMTGYSGDTLLFNHLAVYWIGLAGILSLFSFKLWQRGIHKSLKLVFSNWGKWESGVSAAFSFVFLIAGSFVFYNTNVVSEYTNSAENLDLREAYERKFKQYETLGSLYAVEMKTTIDLYPNENRYVVKADYVLDNKSDSAITQLFVTARIPLNKIHLEHAKMIFQDSKFDSYLFEFQEPVLPHQKVKFTFELTQENHGFETNKQIQANGTYITHRDFEPTLNYISGFEISNNFERKKRGLPEIEEEIITDSHLEMEGKLFGKVNYETIISTQSDEIALGTGSLVKQWKENERNFYHFKTKQKVLPTMAYFSARYKIQKELFNGVSIENYFDANHAVNIDSIQTFARQTLDYCIANFGEYPFDHLRIAEVPSFWPMGGFAHPGVISMVEDNLYLIDTRDAEEFNLVAKRTIHEVAHQWWGHLLCPKIVEGGSIFVEGFAKYTEAVLMEKMYGKRALWELSLNANSRYFPGRAFASEKEPPLYLVNGQGYLSYGKNYTVMLALRDLIGEETLNHVLRKLADNHRDKTEFDVQSLEFLAELYQITPNEYHVLIDDWFKRVITYDLSAEEASYTELENGTFEITLNINAKRFETNENGAEVEISINEPISIGLFSTHPSQVSGNESIIYLKSHQITQKKMDLKIIVDRLPKYVAIDPFGTRSDPNLNNNVLRL